MIYTGTSEVGGIYVGDTEIAEVYRGTDLVYQNFPKFTTFEANGWSGTKTGTLALHKGLYRITISASGGSYGYSRGATGKHAWVNFDKTCTYGGGGGGGMYGLMRITQNCYRNYRVGGQDDYSFFGDVGCSAGGVGNSCAAGTVWGKELFSSIAVAGGNAGAQLNNRVAASGGASFLVYTDSGGGDLLPPINLTWGRGASVHYTGPDREYASWSENRSNGDWVPGYLKVERIGSL